MTSLLYILFSCNLPPITVEPHWYDPFRTISWCQFSRLITQKMTQYSYASFYMLIRPRKTQSFTTNVQHVAKLRLYDTLHPMWTRKGMRHAQSRAVDTSHSSFPAVLAGPCRIKMLPCTQLPLSIPANLFTGCCTSHSQLYIIAISIFTYLFESACGVVLLKAFCMLLKGNTSNASPYPATGGTKWAPCFALPALYFGAAHQLDFVLVFRRRLRKPRNRKMTKRVSGCLGPTSLVYVGVSWCNDSLTLRLT